MQIYLQLWALGVWLGCTIKAPVLQEPRVRAPVRVLRAQKWCLALEKWDLGVAAGSLGHLGLGSPRPPGPLL